MPIADGKLTDADRIMLTAMLDRLIPPVDGFAGAGGLGLAAEIEKVAGTIPRFQKALAQTLGALSLDMASHAYGGFKALPPEEQDHAIQAVEQSMAGPFTQFLELVYLVYYSDPRVHERIGWKTGPLQPVGFEMEPFDESILENIRKRKPFWRQV